jgi:succinylglutamate desuccinylase
VLSGGLLVLALAASVVAALVPAPSRPTAGAATAVIQSRVIGRSVLNRPIIAYRLGDPSSPVKVIILGQMHGDEPAGVTVANSIIAQRQAVTGIDLWVIPTMNPDGAARHTRQNIHGVDLNRNWPDRWARLTGEFYSGPAPLSEPETKAMYAFLKLIKPRYLVSLHQPLNGVDTTDGGAREPALSRTLARSLGLPQKAFNCNSECLGSMTGWMTRYQKGSGITIEFGAAPSRAYLTGQARLGILSAVRGRLASLSSRNPHAHIDRAAARAAPLRSPAGCSNPITERPRLP